ncbi:MAG: hypothetical protein JWM10_2414, partial [Myxococcaceae bacterium]|nr:hypothetical protein [Myxococcaceae bacterium]
RFFADRTVVDLVGLNEHALAHHPFGSTAYLCHLLSRRPAWFVVPSGWVARYEPAWRFTPYAAARSDRYAQLDPPVRHTVVILRAEARPEALARCAVVSAARGAARAPPSGP